MGLDSVFPNGLSVGEAVDVLQPVALYVVGMAFYAVFIFNFYRFVARRDMFTFDTSRFEDSRYRALRSFWHFIMYVVKYLVVFPLFAFFWFAVLTAMLSFLSEGRLISEILLIALATVSAIRFSAYYDEDLSRDLAKILPFALLALFIIDATFFDFGNSVETLQDVNDYWETIAYYLVFLIGLEFVLRFGFGFSVWLFRKTPVRPRSKPRKESAIPSGEADDQSGVDDGESEDRSGA